MSAAPLEFQTRELPRAAVRAGYTAPLLVASDGRCPHADIGLSIAGGELPRGLELSGGSISGVPADLGTFRFRVRAANGCATATQEFTLFVTARPVLRVSPEQLIFEYQAGGPRPAPQSVLVSSTWPELAYSAEITGGSWLRLEQRDGMTPGQGSAFAGDAARIHVDPSKLEPGVYNTTLVFSAWNGAASPRVDVTLKIFPAPDKATP